MISSLPAIKMSFNASGDHLHPREETSLDHQLALLLDHDDDLRDLLLRLYEYLDWLLWHGLVDWLRKNPWFIGMTLYNYFRHRWHLNRINRRRN